MVLFSSSLSLSYFLIRFSFVYFLGLISNNLFYLPFFLSFLELSFIILFSLPDFFFLTFSILPSSSSFLVFFICLFTLLCSRVGTPFALSPSLMNKTQDSFIIIIVQWSISLFFPFSFSYVRTPGIIFLSPRPFLPHCITLSHLTLPSHCPHSFFFTSYFH